MQISLSLAHCSHFTFSGVENWQKFLWWKFRTTRIRMRKHKGNLSITCNYKLPFHLFGFCIVPTRFHLIVFSTRLFLSFFRFLDSTNFVHIARPKNFNWKRVGRLNSPLYRSMGLWDVCVVWCGKEISWTHNQIGYTLHKIQNVNKLFEAFFLLSFCYCWTFDQI